MDCGTGSNPLAALSPSLSSQCRGALAGRMDLFLVLVILSCLELSEFSSHVASAFRCSALSSSALRSSARDKARPRRAGRHSAAEPMSPLKPVAEGKMGGCENTCDVFDLFWSKVVNA